MDTMTKSIKEQFDLWDRCVQDDDLRNQLARLKGNQKAIEDAFYCDLEFGTAGLRGVLGVGTNRLNVYTVARASSAVAQYLCKQGAKKAVVCYDSRLCSQLFAQTAASVFCEYGLQV
ncbi:MAG: phospho-sugar mutase, partial [Firmicutes bacterium]|nr:phospho-sugar mutase [Bacillota bacterium]